MRLRGALYGEEVREELFAELASASVGPNARIEISAKEIIEVIRFMISSKVKWLAYGLVTSMVMFPVAKVWGSTTIE